MEARHAFQFACGGGDLIESTTAIVLLPIDTAQLSVWAVPAAGAANEATTSEQNTYTAKSAEGNSNWSTEPTQLLQSDANKA